MTAPELDLDELERLERAATPGPWRVCRETWRDGTAYCDGIEAPSETIVKTDSGVYPPELADADFIAAARNAMPLLVGALKSTLLSLRAAEARVKELADIAKGAIDEFEYASQYKGTYMAQKHGDAETIARWREALVKR